MQFPSYEWEENSRVYHAKCEFILKNVRLVGVLDSRALICLRTILVFESSTRFPLSAVGPLGEYLLTFLVFLQLFSGTLLDTLPPFDFGPE